jgi:hypothetical protein
MGTPKKLEQPWPHDAKGEPIEPDERADNPPVLGPAGRLHCSLGDWAKFVADQLKGARGADGLLPASAYQMLHRPARAGARLSAGGWAALSTPRGWIIAADGSNTLNYSTAILLPGPDLAVLVVCNQGGDPGMKACHQARDALLARLFR